MKKILPYIALLISGLAFSQTILIPDPNLKAALLAANTENGIAQGISQNYIIVDTNGNGDIEVSEANNVYHLLVGGYEISSMTGIDNFQNLQTLQCSSNNLTTLNVSALTNLRDLDCNFNQITSLNVAGLSALEWLNCANNNLTTLNLTGCIMLHHLDFSYNQLTAIDLSSQQSTLLNLTANDNALTAIDVAGFPLLDYLYIEYNSISALDLAGCYSLTYVAAAYNQIESLDVSDSPFLEMLDIDNNQLQVLIIKNGVDNSDAFYDFAQNPLEYLCVDETEAEAYIEILDFYGYNNVVMNTYCMFTPGGNYNRITGSIKFDGDNNGCNATDEPQRFVKVNINGDAGAGATFTSADGNYNFYLQDGNFVVAPVFENNWFTVAPGSANANFPVVDNSTQTYNFCVTANGVHPDAEVVIAPIEMAQPGFDAVYKIVYRNNGNQVLSGSVTFNFPDELMDYVSSMPAEASITGGSVTWNYTGLQPFEDRDIYVTVNINAPTDTPAVNIDDVLMYNVAITTNTTDETPGNNAFAYEETVSGSFDPNDIRCLEGNTASPDVIGDYLHYNVNFENTGTAAATFIVVELDVNPADFNINTFQVLDASHEMLASIEGNRVKFYFANIDLGPLEHGNILFKLKSNNFLDLGDNVINQANIFFDYNFPIETNEANTVFELLSRGEFEVDDTVNIYPNPSGGIIHIKSANGIQSCELYDLQGRMLQRSVYSEAEAIIDVSPRSSGIYFLKVRTEKGFKIEKIIKN